ncbi:FAD-binding protein [Curtobacterium sp. PhB136]|uniref:FAD-binding oxidoreductase n=1 Tax=Curtobacterium sp. PhB136 TaxID=2485181 RepID=UPI0010F1D542|nr:FAD-binding protein [Curtobacterium sp. PhB136]TCK65755.1 FAD/FMN-containing dehydrogenase [Curtobacterium sp. PhB136]
MYWRNTMTEGPAGLVRRLLEGVAPGNLILPSAPIYDSARLVYNRMHDKRPAAVVRTLDVRTLRIAIAAAIANGSSIAVRGGGHHIGGFSTIDDGLLLDFSTFRGVEYDPGTHTVRIEPGARLGDLDRALAAVGRCVPAGTVSDTGVGGLTLGGGIGWLVASGGLTCDYLVSADILLADGALITASETEHTDLFRALRGGGVGAFGVVTEFTFRTIALPTIVTASVAMPLESSAATIRRLQGLHRGNGLTRATVAPVLSRAGLSVDICVRLPDDGEIRVLEEELQLMPDCMRLTGYVEWQSNFDDAFFPERRGYWKSVHFDESDVDLDQLSDAIESAPSDGCTAMIEFYNTDTLQARAAGSAYPRRNSRIGVLLTARWDLPEDDDAHIAWARRWARVLRQVGGATGYSNYSGTEDGGIRAGFDADTLDLFEGLERAYDPSGVFRNGHRGSIRGRCP